MPIRLDPEGNETAALFDFAGSFAVELLPHRPGRL